MTISHDHAIEWQLEARNRYLRARVSLLSAIGNDTTYRESFVADANYNLHRESFIADANYNLHRAARASRLARYYMGLEE